MHDLRSIRLVCAPPHKSYDLRGGFSAPSPCRTNDTAFQHLRSGGEPEGAMPASGSPAALSHNSAATDSLQNSDNPAGRSLRGCLRVSAVHSIRGGPCPLGLPCGSISSPSRHGCSTGSDNPAGRSLRGCLSMTPQTRRSIFLNRDAGELRLGQITPTALPSSRQTAS